MKKNQVFSFFKNVKRRIFGDAHYDDFEVFNQVKKAIFVAAHPDDIEGCAGGTIRRLVLQGVQVFSVNCTSGNIGSQNEHIKRESLALVREEETEKAAKLLGITDPSNLGHHDGELEPTLELRAELAKRYRQTQADTLFTFDPFWTEDLHPDHRAAGQAALDAVIPAKMPLYYPDQLESGATKLSRIERIFLFYPERNPDVDVVVDISDVFGIKVDALMAHDSQFPDKGEIRKWLEEWNRDVGKSIKVQFAEGFKQKRIF